MKAALKAMFTKEKIQYHAPVWVCLLFITWLAILPTGYQEIYREAEQCVAKVIQTDESKIIDTGLVRSGEQRCQLEIVSGKFKGRTAEGVNMLNGSLEQDKLFREGDRAQVVVSYNADEILMVTMIDHDRIPMELVMGAIFILFLILFAGRTGVRAVLSFFLTVLAIWKLLVPLYLKGYNPIWTGLVFTLLLSVLIIALVYRKAFRGVLFSPSFANTLIMLCMITTPVVMCIKSNIALSMGMVGALSIVRFRTAVKDPLDTAYMFWSLTMGILLGAELYTIALVVVAGISIAMLALAFFRLRTPNTFLLVTHYDQAAEAEVMDFIRRIKVQRLRSKTVTPGGVELTVEVQLRERFDIVNKLMDTEGVHNATLIACQSEAGN